MIRRSWFLVAVLLLLAVQSLAQEKNEYLSGTVKETDVLRDSLKNPDSLRVDKVFYKVKKNGKDYELCYEYGATNSYGGMVRGAGLVDQKGKLHSPPLHSNSDTECFTGNGWNQYNHDRQKDAVEITDEYKAAIAALKK